MSNFAVKVNDHSQILTSFPNQNNKHIDYVLVYEKFQFFTDEDIKCAKDLSNFRKTTGREAFFKALKAEQFEIYEIEQKLDEKILVFSLLNCSTERLLDEAELTRHEMVLKNVNCKNIGKIVIIVMSTQYHTTQNTKSLYRTILF